MGRGRTRKSAAEKLNKRKTKFVYTEDELQAAVRKILDGVFLNRQGQCVSGHDLDEDEQDNLVGHVYIQMVMRLASQRAGFLDANGNPTPKAFESRRKLLRD